MWEYVGVMWEYVGVMREYVGVCGSLVGVCGIMWEYDDMRKTYRYTFVEYRNSCALKR